MDWSGTAAFPLIPSQEALNVFEQLRKSPKFMATRNDWDFRPVQGDLNATTAKKYFDFNLENSKGTIPVLGGSSLNIYNPNFGPPFAVADEKIVRQHLLEKFQSASSKASSAYYRTVWKDSKKLPIDSPRISFRNVTNQTNTRTAIVCLLPPSVIATHGIPVLVRSAGDEKAEAFLLGVMSSRIFDWYARRWVELNFTFELLNHMPIPIYKTDDKRALKLISNTAQLAATDSRYKNWAESCGLVTIPQLNLETREELIIENDALVAHLYSLSRKQVMTVFKTFHNNWNYTDQLDKTFDYFDKWGQDDQ
jgi:hypothetical protein